MSVIPLGKLVDHVDMGLRSTYLCLLLSRVVGHVIFAQSNNMIGP